MVIRMTSVMVRMIIKQGMPVDVKDKRQMTAMHHAISGMTSFTVTLDITPCRYLNRKLRTVSVLIDWKIMGA